jgi:uncharacterized protein (DUF983 family)
VPPASDPRPDVAGTYEGPMQPEGGFLRRAWGTLKAILLMRCPRCRKGKMFRGRFTMNDPCPVCGLLFQREEGTFLGAMYVSYVLALALVAPLYFLTAWMMPRASGYLTAFVAMLLFVPLMPSVFRYSRVIWVYFERFGAPSDLSAGAYEKFRQKQLDERNGETPTDENRQP